MAREITFCFENRCEFGTIQIHMLYTKKGDDGKTSAYHCDQRFSKSSAIAEALGSLDETNSFLGIVKINAKEFRLKQSSVEDCSPEQILSTKFTRRDGRKDWL